MLIFVNCIGTKEERGLVLHGASDESPEEREENERRTKNIYNIPFCGESISKQKWSHYVPFCPGYGEVTKEVEAEMDDTVNKSTNHLVTMDELQESTGDTEF